MTSPDTPQIRAACPVCGHPLLVERWQRADTLSTRLTEEAVIVHPAKRQPLTHCPGCRLPLEELRRQYEAS